MVIGFAGVSLEEVDGVGLLKKIESAGRTCYRSEEAITESSCYDFVKKIISLGHLSVIEHASVTARIVCDRGVSHELVRHRIGTAFSMESTRYVSYGGRGISLIPMMDDLTEAQANRRLDLYTMAESVYLAEISEGIKPEQARDNLPTCTRTEIAVTCNLREWRHIFELRCAPKAHPQIRRVAKMLLSEMSNVVPVVFDDLREKFLGDRE